MKNKTVIVTGGARRIGKEIALYCARKGYDIALHYHSSEEDALAVKNEIEKIGSNCEIFQADLGNHFETENLISEIIQKMNTIEVLINNASIFKKATIGETEYDLLEKTFVINAFSPFLLMKSFSKVTKNGVIVNIIDTKATDNLNGYAAYTLSKKFLLSLTKMSAVEFAPEIRVCGIAPGVILPPEGKGDDYLRDLIEKKVPLKRKGNPGLIADAVGYIIDNKYLTGQILFIDGGMHLM